MWAVILRWISKLCMPRKNFTARELELLGLEYELAPIPKIAFASFRYEKNSEQHVTDLLALMQGFPEWKLNQHARDILNGTFQWKRRIGYGMFHLITVGSQCTCCSGWRVLFLVAGALGAGFAAGRIHIYWG